MGVSLVLSILLLYQSNGVDRLNTLFYDTMLAVHQRPANEELVIVAVDEKSLHELGNWPWSRRVHAELLDRLSASGASVVGLDLPLSAPDRSDPEGDALLARAIDNSGGVVLVVGPDSGTGSRPVSEVLPLPQFAAVAAGIAHIDFEMDRDGIYREVFLQAGTGDQYWPALGLAMVGTAYPRQTSLTSPSAPEDRPLGAGWVRGQPVLIPFSGAPGHFSQVSYVDVLQGRVPPEVVRDRLVLVGATAAGLGDFVSTPVSTLHKLMSGVEVNANVAAALLDGRLLQEASPIMGILFSVLLIFALVLWLIYLPGRLALFGYLCVTFLALLLSIALLYFGQIWISPAVALLCQTALYVIWSWLDPGPLSRISRQLSGQIQLQ